MFRRIGSVVGIAVGLAGLLSGCYNKPVVGVIMPTSGEAASYGESIESGVRLALSDARERNQLPEGFEILWADTGSDPAQAAIQLQKMVTERDVKLVIGGATSAEAIAMLPVLDDLEVVCLSPSASAPGLAQRSKFISAPAAKCRTRRRTPY